MMRSVSARRTLSPTVGPNICAYSARLILRGMPVTSMILGCWYLRQCSHDGLVEPIKQARALVGDQANFAGEARLEAHSCSRRNVQAIPKRSLSIKSEGRVGLSEMIMAADLNRSVACVGDTERYGRPILVQDDLASRRKNLARYHLNPPFLKRASVQRKPAGPPHCQS